ncbi:uncharacterized protein LOC144798620 isoform X2 [Lissotriton helveticus]
MRGDIETDTGTVSIHLPGHSLRNKISEVQPPSGHSKNQDIVGRCKQESEPCYKKVFARKRVPPNPAKGNLRFLSIAWYLR